VRTGLLMTAGWLAAAAAASAVSWSAVTLARSAVTPKTASQAAAGGGAAGRLTASPTSAPSRSPRGTGPASPSGQAGPTGRSTPGHLSDPVLAPGTGGTVIFRCDGSTPVIQNVTPWPGFSQRVDDSGSGEVRFESDSHRTEIKVSCAGGRPRWTAEEKAEGGGGSGKGGGSSGHG
jgi:hypothetical protein